MIEVNLVFVLLVLLAGIVTFLAPCTLPLVPAFLGFMSGVSLGDAEAITPAARRRIVTNTVFYIIGFSVVFISLGTLAGIAGTLLVPVRFWLTRIGGVIVILFGFYLLGFVKIPIFSTRSGFTSGGKSGLGNIGGGIKKKRGPLASLAFGASFGAG